MRFGLLSCLLVGSVGWASPSLELEVGAGAHGYTQAAPTFAGKVGLQVTEWFTPGVKAMSLSSFGQDSSAWAVLADFRFHTAPRLFQLNGGVGLGLALATVGEATRVGQVSPYLLGDIGVRLNLWRFFVGLNVGGSPFNTGWLGMLTVGVAPFGRD